MIKAIKAQVKNPKTGKYIKIDKDKGEIIGRKQTDGPYKGIPIAKSNST